MADITLEQMHEYTRHTAVERLRTRFPVGTRIVLIEMDDPQAPPSGTQGSVRGVDDIGGIMVAWDTGGSLSLIPGVDRFTKLL